MRPPGPAVAEVPVEVVAEEVAAAAVVVAAVVVADGRFWGTIQELRRGPGPPAVILHQVYPPICCVPR